jgi:hypothetical protein
MTALPDGLRDDPQVAVTILATEHYNLQTARAATISETGGRASVFLGSVSAGLVLRTEGYRPGRWQMMVSIVGAIGVIDSVLFGVTAGLAAAALSDSDLWVATPVGLVSFAIALCLHQRHQQLRRAQAHAFDMGDQGPRSHVNRRRPFLRRRRA